MTTQAPAPRTGARNNVALLVIVGVVLVAGAFAAAGWMTGYLKPKPRVALVTWNEDPFWDLVIDGARDSANRMNLDLTVIRSKPDEKTQSQHVRELLDGGVQCIAISPNNPQAQAALLDEVATKAKLVTFDSDALTKKRYAFVGTDNYNAGVTAGEQVLDAVPEGGEVLVSVGSVEMDNAKLRRLGLLDTVLDRRSNKDAGAPLDPVDQPLKGAKYTVVGTVLDGGDSAKATSLVAEALKAHPNVKCVVGLFSYSAPAIVRALDQAGMKGKVKIIGFDEADDTQAGIVDGTIYCSILQDQYRCGYEAVYAMSEAIRGNEMAAPNGARIFYLRTWVMKKDNLDDLRAEKMVHQPGAAKQPS